MGLTLALVVSVMHCMALFLGNMHGGIDPGNSQWVVVLVALNKERHELADQNLRKITVITGHVNEKPKNKCCFYKRNLL